MAIDFKALLAQHHNPDLAKADGHVYQVWEDGEITLQKCGELLWMRNLHCITDALPDRRIAVELFPDTYNGHGYIFTTRDGAEAVRAAIAGE